MTTLPDAITDDNRQMIRDLFEWLIDPCLGVCTCIRVVCTCICIRVICTCICIRKICTCICIRVICTYYVLWLYVYIYTRTMYDNLIDN